MDTYNSSATRALIFVLFLSTDKTILLHSTNKLSRNAKRPEILRPTSHTNETIIIQKKRKKRKNESRNRSLIHEIESVGATTYEFSRRIPAANYHTRALAPIPSRALSIHIYMPTIYICLLHATHRGIYKKSASARDPREQKNKKQKKRNEARHEFRIPRGGRY